MVAAAQSPKVDHLFELVGRTPAVAARHGLSAIIAEGLANPPEELLQDARSQVSAGLKRKILTLAVVDALAGAGVVPVLLKGYALAVRLYPSNPLGRPSTDVDVLVRPEELERCGQALAKLGLKHVVDDSLHDVFEEHHHLSFSGQRGLVEVHFRLFSGFGGGVFDDAALLQRARPLKLDGRQVRVLGPEDEFLYLATHAANHAYLRLSWLVDLERYLLAVPDLDFALMAARARSAGFSAAVSSALLLLERELGVALPRSARRHFTSPFWRKAMESLVFSTKELRSARFSEHWLGGFALRLLLVDSAAHGVRHVMDGALRQIRRARAES